MNNQRGLTLIEMIIYIALVSTLSTSIVGLYIHIISLKSQALVMQEVNDSVRFAAARIDSEIRRAVSVLGVGDSLSLITPDTQRNPTSFELADGRILMRAGATSAYITSNLVTITNLSLTNLSSVDGKSINIRYSLSGLYQDRTATVTGSAELRSK